MSDHRRALETRWFRPSVSDGTADAVAMGTMSIGLVLGAMEKLWPASIPVVRYGHGFATPSSIAAADAAVSAPLDAAQPPWVDFAAAGHAFSPPLATDDASSASFDRLGAPSPEDKAAGEALDPTSPGLPADHTSAAGQQPMSTSNLSHDDAHGIAAPSIEPVVDTVQPMFDALGSLLDQVKNLPADVEGLWSPLQQATDLGEAAVQQIFDDVASVVSKAAALLPQAQPVFDITGSLLDQMKALPEGIEGPSSPAPLVTDLSEATATPVVHDIGSGTSTGIDPLAEVLGGPPPDPGAAIHAPDLPATILGASTDSLSTGGHVASAPLQMPDATHSDALGTGAMSTAGHDDVPAVEMPPLQLGFLGQSYVDVADHHDNGPHTLSSPLHGFI